MPINPLIALQGRPMEVPNIAGNRMALAHADLYEQQAAKQRREAQDQQEMEQMLQQTGGTVDDNLVKQAFARNPRLGVGLQQVRSKIQADKLAAEEAANKTRKSNLEAQDQERKTKLQLAEQFSGVAGALQRELSQIQDPAKKLDLLHQRIINSARIGILTDEQALQFIRGAPQWDEQGIMGQLEFLKSAPLKLKEQQDMELAANKEKRDVNQEARAAEKAVRDAAADTARLPGIQADAQYSQARVKGQTPEQKLAAEQFQVSKWTAQQNAQHAKNMEGLTLRGQNMNDARARELNAATRDNRPPTGAESTALGYYQRGLRATEMTDEFEKQIQEMGLFGQAGYQFLPNAMQPEANQMYQSGQRQFTEARLRKDSGAAIPKSEYENDARMYFVQPGDTPAVVEEKRRSRQQILESLRAASGRAGMQYYGTDRPTAANRPTPAAGGGAPKVGEIRYKGGVAYRFDGAAWVRK